MSSERQIVDTARLRDYGDAAPARVVAHYRAMHRGQTVSHVEEMRQRFDLRLGTHREELSILEAADRFIFIDEADPDFEADNLLHCYQTGEACRKTFPDQDWLHLVGFLHDLGKAALARAGLPQWSISGDIFPVGCGFGESNVHTESFASNPDATDERYAAPLGIYQERCGFENVLFSFGHDQYLYDVLRAHQSCTIPEEALYLIRFHSFYPWHQAEGYAELASPRDRGLLPLLRAFQKCDLYSKIDDLPEPDALRPYYAALIERYCPGTLRW